ncbi:MAG: ATP-binding protein [Escherichia sp.]
MVVEVEDSGCGIDPAKLAKSSSHLFRLAQTRRHGLGLTISSRLAQAMGGELSATSTPEVGSCFVYACRYVLPRTRAKNSQSGGASDGLRLLLIEDNPLTQRITVEMLNSSGRRSLPYAAQALEHCKIVNHLLSRLVDLIRISTALRLPGNWHSNIRRWF